MRNGEMENWYLIPRSSLIELFENLQPSDLYATAYQVIQSSTVELPRQISYWKLARNVLNQGYTDFESWYHQSGMNYQRALNIWYYTGKPYPRDYLTQLPPEILVKILVNLDWASLVNVCRTGQIVSCSDREFWLNMLSERCLSNLGDISDRNLTCLYRQILSSAGRVKVKLEKEWEVPSWLAKGLKTIEHIDNWIGVTFNPGFLLLLDSRGKVYIITKEERYIWLDLPPIRRLDGSVYLYMEWQNIFGPWL